MQLRHQLGQHAGRGGGAAATAARARRATAGAGGRVRQVGALLPGGGRAAPGRRLRRLHTQVPTTKCTYSRSVTKC